MLTPITNVVLVVIAMAGAVYVTKQELEKSQEVFYKDISIEIEDMIEHVREVVNGRDEQRLIAILFRSLQDFIMFTLNGDCVRQHRLGREDWDRYNNRFFTILASVEVEWYVKGVDSQLSDLFRMKKKILMLSHIRRVYMIFKDGRLSVKQRREAMAKEYLRLIKEISDKYIEAFDDYKAVLSGNGTCDFHLERAGVTREEVKRIILELRRDGGIPCEFMEYKKNQDNQSA